MKNISILQIIILTLLSILIFSDFSKIKKRLFDLLKKLNVKNLVEYNKAGVNLTEEGERIGSSMMRNSRLLEVLMDSALKVKIDEEMVCGIEHHMNKQFTDALCTMLGHPRKCPHTHEIPMGECCK